MISHGLGRMQDVCSDRQGNNYEILSVQTSYLVDDFCEPRYQSKFPKVRRRIV
jgi:hypothetical protein